MLVVWCNVMVQKNFIKQEEMKKESCLGVKEMVMVMVGVGDTWDWVDR